MRAIRQFVLWSLLFIIAVPAAAQSTKVAALQSPSGTLSLTLTTNGEGRVGYAVMRGTQAVINEVRGRIVNISSQHGMIAAPEDVAYGTSKSGIWMR